MLTGLLTIVLTAQATAPAPTPATAKPKLICTRDADVGSLITHQTCRTAKQIEQESEAAQREKIRVDEAGTINSRGNGG